LARLEEYLEMLLLSVLLSPLAIALPEPSFVDVQNIDTIRPEEKFHELLFR
jgi:hypothetical protein